MNRLPKDRKCPKCRKELIRVSVTSTVGRVKFGGLNLTGIGATDMGAGVIMRYECKAKECSESRLFTETDSFG